VIAGATKPEQIELNAAAAAWVPTDADRRELQQLLAG
jgi:aryl-alcohol dehydrogenase-like predicted oxidoreductase